MKHRKDPLLIGAALAILLTLGSLLASPSAMTAIASSFGVAAQPPAAEPAPEVYTVGFSAEEAFHWLDPIAPSSGDTSNLDATLLSYLTVEVCEVASAGCTTVRTFNSTGTSAEQLRIVKVGSTGGYFIVNWDTQKAKISLTKTYRIIVSIPGVVLGSIDLAPATYRTFGRTWPIKFLVEKNAEIRTRLLVSLGLNIWEVADELRSGLGICGDDLAQALLENYPNATPEEVAMVVDNMCQDVIIPPTTKIADTATRESLASFDPAGGTMFFSTETSLLKNLKVNDVMVSKPSVAAPYGYLRKVASIRKDRGSYTVETVQASLTEAVHQGKLDISGEILPSDELPAGSITDGQSARTSELRAETAVSQSANSLSEGCSDASGTTGYSFECSVDETFDFEKGEGEFTGTGQVRVAGKVFFSAGYDIGAGIEFCARVPIPACMDRFEARLRVKQKSELHIDGNLDATLEKEIVIARKIFKPITFWLGPIPVVVVPVVNLVVGTKGTAHVEFEFDATDEAGFAIGAKWTDPGDGGKGWENVSEKLNFDGTADGDVSGNITLIGYYKGNAKLLLYGTIGPSFGAVLGGRIDAQVPRKPAWSIYGHIAGDLAFEISIIDVISLSRFSLSYFVVDEPHIADAANQPPVFSNIRDGAIQARVGRPVFIGPDDGLAGKNYDVADPEGDIPTLSFEVPPDGVMSGQRVTYSTPGLKTVKVTARDSDGLTADLYLGVDVRNSPPEVTINPPSGEVQATVQYWLTASAYDPEEGKLRCSRLTWDSTGDYTKTVSSNDRTCTAVFKFADLGPHTVTVTATDSQGLPMSKTHQVNVTSPPAEPMPDIEPDSFSIQAISRIRRPGDDPFELGCLPGQLCEVQNGDFIYNGYGGDFIPPLIMRLNASDPNGGSVVVDWHCQTGQNFAPITDNGDGSYSCNPIYSPFDPIKVYARVYIRPPLGGDGNGAAVRSEERTFFMLQAPN